MNKRASQNKPELWIEEDRRLFYAEAITIKSTGECFKVEDKLAKIHTYMGDQYNSYQADGKSFYEDQRDIATKCKCTPKTLGKWLKVLQALGLLIIDESQKSHSYTVRSVVSQEHNLIFDYPKLLNGKPTYDHEEALKRLYASQDRKNVKNLKPKIEESDKNEQKQQQPSTDAPETAAPVAGKPDGVPVVDVPVDVDVPANDDAVNASTQYTDEQLRAKLRKWRNWGLDDEARAFCLSHGIEDNTDNMTLFIQRYQMPIPKSEPVQDDFSGESIPF
ncbi:DUF6945 domain-containing protein [Citrobacter portucalensis]|uniref:DUF6945 domain-containing protein n=1 Tax=Citrobacter portucalensis TaxID=1639133 RepID=UPI0039FBCCE2